MDFFSGAVVSSITNTSFCWASLYGTFIAIWSLWFLYHYCVYWITNVCADVFTGTLAVSISFPLIFLRCFPCAGDGMWGHLFYYAPFIAVFQFGWAAVQIAHMALMSQLTQDKSQQTQLSGLRLVCVDHCFSLYSTAAKQTRKPCCCKETAQCNVFAYTQWLFSCYLHSLHKSRCTCETINKQQHNAMCYLPLPYSIRNFWDNPLVADWLVPLSSEVTSVVVNPCSRPYFA